MVPAWAMARLLSGNEKRGTGKKDGSTQHGRTPAQEALLQRTGQTGEAIADEADDKQAKQDQVHPEGRAALDDDLAQAIGEVEQQELRADGAQPGIDQRQLEARQDLRRRRRQDQPFYKQSQAGYVPWRL